MKKRSFTLIELIVVVVLFMIIFLITMAFVNLASGQVKSLHTKMLTNNVRSAMETISQKINNANRETTVAGVGIVGFTINNGILGIASSASGGVVNCTFFGLKDNAIWMHDGCTISAWSNSILDKQLTSDKIKVTNAAAPVTPLFTMDGERTVNIKIKAQDADPKYETENTIEIQTSYMIDYATWKQMNPNP